MCDTKTFNYGYPVQSHGHGLYAHISEFGQLFAPEYQHHILKSAFGDPSGVTRFRPDLYARDKT